jgi:putative 4-mercaptohistidine N1-methyltranferase
MSSAFYESDDAVAQYLLFHYGTPEQICPLLPEARAACGFPARCVSEPLRHIDLRHRGRALDLGCAVGRGSFELARHFDDVLGIDFSARFVAEADRLRLDRRATIRVPREGTMTDEIKIELPADLRGENIRFERGDACNLPTDLGPFDLVLMANLIDRLPDPAHCLARAPGLINPGGWLIITSPYTWLEEYTPRAQWLEQGHGTLAALREHLAPSFAEKAVFDLPFLIREHRRKFQWSIAEVSVWQRHP